jgi:hypothetical protein
MTLDKRRIRFLQQELGLARLGAYLNQGFVRMFLSQQAWRIYRKLEELKNER